MKSYLVKGTVSGRATEQVIKAFSPLAAREMFFTIYGRKDVVVYSTNEVK